MEKKVDTKKSSPPLEKNTDFSNNTGE